MLTHTQCFQREIQLVLRHNSIAEVQPPFLSQYRAKMAKSQQILSGHGAEVWCQGWFKYVNRVAEIAWIVSSQRAKFKKEICDCFYGLPRTSVGETTLGEGEVQQTYPKEKSSLVN